MLTESLAVVLRDLGDRDVSWGVVADLVRRRVLTVTALQRPEVEGPAERVPFSVRTKARPYALAVTADASGLFIEAAPLLGVSLGDAFQLQVPGTGEELATAVVERFAGDRAVLTITTPPMGEFPVALDAVPLRMAVPKQAVRLDVRDDTRAALRTLLDASPRLRLAKTNEPAIATIVGDGGLVVRDSNRAPLHSGTLTDDRVGRHRAVNLIEVAARAERLRALTSGHQGTTYLETPVVIELASHGAAGRSIRAQYGEQLFNGESISVTVRNDGDKAVYIWLFDIGVANQITLTTNDAPSGFRLSPAGSPGDARTIGGADGIPLSWPPGIPADGPRVETFVVIIADRPQDLHVLESSRSHERVRTTSSLDAILDEVRIGTREWPIVQTDAGLRYRVERIEFLLDPRTKSAFDEPVFEVDETPHLTLRLLQPRTAALPPGRVAVRLAELVVRRNGALFGASIRIDTLVMTGSEAGGVVATPRTMHFPNVHAGDILPLENALLYLGDVHEFLDLALWVWREDSKGKDLAELFADQIGTDDMQGALTVVGGLILASSAVLPAVGVVAAAAMLLRIAARLVHTATRRDIGVYRTSKLAFERFGVGRTPPQHRKQAQNVEFAYEIVEVE